MQQSTANRLPSVEHNYSSLFQYSHMFRSFTAIIGSAIQYVKVTKNANSSVFTLWGPISLQKLL